MADQFTSTQNFGPEKDAEVEEEQTVISLDDEPEEPEEPDDEAEGD